MVQRIESHRSRAEVERSLVGFQVGDGLYAVDVPVVREIISPAALVSVPHSAGIVRGVTDHRGHVVPVVDLRKRFGLPQAEQTRRTKWIVVETGGVWLGLVVDGVTEVFRVGPANERQAPRLGPDDVARGFSAVYVHERVLVLVLDLEVLARAVEQGGGAVPTPSWKPPAGNEGAP